MERVPKKKAGRALKKRYMLLILACAALLIGAGAYFLRPKPQVPEPIPRAETIWLLRHGADEIVSIDVALRTGESYALTVREGALRLKGQEDVPLRDWLAEDILSVVSGFAVQQVAVNTAGLSGYGLRLSDFGLEPPLAVVTVTCRDGTATELRFGDATPDEEPTRYCLRRGDSRIFTVMTEDSDVFLHEKDYLRAFDQPGIDASLLDRVDIAGDITFGAYYTPSGWQMDAPFSYPLSTVRTDRLLSAIEAMGFEALLGRKDSLNLADYGLDHPALTVTLTQGPTVLIGENGLGETVAVDAPPVVYTLEIGDEMGQSGVYLAWQGQVFKASNFFLGFWKEFSVEEMLLREPVNLLVNDLNRVTLEYGDVSARYEVRMVEALTPNNQIATDEYGRTLYDCAVRRAGEDRDMDAEAFLDWYIRLASLSPAGKLPAGYVADGSPRARIILENDHLTRVIALIPWDALHDALSVDGVAVYYVDKTWLDRVTDTP